MLNFNTYFRVPSEIAEKSENCCSNILVQLLGVCNRKTAAENKTDLNNTFYR